MITFVCSGCQTSYTVGDDKAGKTGKCRKCQATFTVPAATAAPPLLQPDPEDEAPRKRPTRQAELEPEEDRPRKRAARREEDAEASEPPRRGRRRPADAEDDAPRPERKPRAKLSPLDRSLGMIRRSQFFDLLTFFALLIVAAVLYVGLTSSADRSKTDYDAAKQKFDEDIRQWWREQPKDAWVKGVEWIETKKGKVAGPIVRPPQPRPAFRPEPERPAILRKDSLSRAEAGLVAFKEQTLLRCLPLVPAFLLILAGLFATVGRFRVGANGMGSGGGRVFVATAFIALGRLLLGLALFAGTLWMVVDANSLSDDPDKDGVAILGGVAGGFGLALYCGVLGEVLSLPGLALIGWKQATTDAQRRRIGSAAAFYPALVVGWFVLTLVLGALAAFVPAIRLPAGILQGVLFLGIQIVQYMVVSRAYRFPPAADAVN